MPEILVKKTKVEPGEASLEVTIPPDNVKAAEDRATKVYQQRARLPGFRQGKAPAAVVRRKFADDIRQEYPVKSRLIEEVVRSYRDMQAVLGDVNCGCDIVRGGTVYQQVPIGKKAGGPSK